jgi:hypothetical protein
VLDEESFRRDFSSASEDQFKRDVQAEIDRVTKEFAFADALAATIGKPFDTKIVPVPPTPAEVARQKYFKDLGVLNAMIEGIKDGIRKDTDPDYLNQLSLVKSEFLPEYEK